MKPDRNQFIGRTLSGFHLQSFLGAGAFAYVYYATGQGGIPVAVKIQYNLQDDARKRFVREIKVLEQLPSSRYTTRYYGSGTTQEGFPYLVMEFIDGTTLKDSLRFKPVWEPTEACQFMVELSEAFAGLHQLGLAHRDVKPENIMLTRDWQVKLMDLGLVKDAQGLLQLFEQEDILAGMDFAENLDRGVLAGTPEYMAPEQFSDPSLEDESQAKTDTTTDVYSLGLIFYELLTGRKLFPFRPRSKNQTEYARALLAYLDERTHQRDDDIARPDICPPALWTIIQRSLRSEPKLRQRNASELGQDIRRYLDTGQGIVVQDEDKTSAIDLNTFLALHGSGLPGAGAARPAPGATPAYKTQPLPSFENTMPPAPAGVADYKTAPLDASIIRAGIQQRQQPHHPLPPPPAPRPAIPSPYDTPAVAGYPQAPTPYPPNPYAQPGFASNPSMAGYPGYPQPHQGFAHPHDQNNSGGISITVWLIIAGIVLGGLGLIVALILL